MKSNYEKLKDKFPPGFIDFFRYLKFRFFYNGKFSLDQIIDNKMEKYLNYRDGFFVELGANDGFTQSNTLFLELKKNWKGVLVEPSLNLYSKLCFYRRNNFLFCNACVPFNYKNKYVQIEYSNDLGLTSVPIDLKTDLPNKKSYISKWKNLTNSNLSKVTFGAFAKTLTSILDECRAPTIIDFLSLDVEGAELDVLKGLDFNKYIFKYIVVESRNIARLESYLRKKNYYLLEKLTHHDYLFTCKKNGS